MTTWIVTIGNRDVQLCGDSEIDVTEKWQELFGENYQKQKVDIPQDFGDLVDQDPKTERYLAPARIMGWIYGNTTKDKSDLVFPLLEVFIKYFTDEKIALDKVYLLLSDQSSIFKDEDIEGIHCPFWTDTCALESIIKGHLCEQLDLDNEQIETISLTPKEESETPYPKGIDHWNAMLSVVEQELKGTLFEDNEIYVSHQASTPAISSAVQFVSISRNDKVQFLVSNQLYNPAKDQDEYEAQVITSSQYWRQMQIQKAQKLLIKGNPGAALEIVDGLPGLDTLGIRKIVDQFNLKPSNEDEFDPKDAAKRVRRSLDLIEIFLKNENYLQAIALLAAAHETFLKATIKFLLVKQYPTINNRNDFSILELINWTNQGLLFVDDRQDSDDDDIKEEIKAQILNANQKLGLGNYDRYIRTSKKIDILRSLNFSVDEFELHAGMKNLKVTNGNNGLLSWLNNLFSDFSSWKLLDWIGTYKRLHENDLRNQLMHNLRGIEINGLKGYFMGFPKEPVEYDATKDNRSVSQVFKQEVRSPFIKAMHQIGLIDSDDEENHIQQELQELSDRLN